MTQATGGLVPEWTLGDRLRKARSLTGLNTTEFAARIGVSAKTINNAENDAHGVRKIVLNAWSLATGVPVVWLETGNVGPNGGNEETGSTTRYRATSAPLIALPTAA